MRLVWLVDMYLAEDEMNGLREAIANTGGICKVQYEPTHDQDFDQEQVMVYGSIEFVKKAEGRFTPGPWCTWKEFECTSIYPKVGGVMLNKDYIMLPAGEVQRRIDELMERYEGGVFLRPNGGDKSFSGFAVRKGMLELSNYWRNFTKWSSPSELVVVAGIKSILEEYRVWVRGDDHSVITASTYKRDGQFVFERGCNGAVASLARTVSYRMNEHSPFPDPIYTIDVCRVPGNGYALVEVNSFSCSGLYASDIERLVRSATEIVTERWDRLHQ